MDPNSPEFQREVLRAQRMADELQADLREEFAKLPISQLLGSLLVMARSNSPQELLLMLINRTHPTLQGLASMSVMMAFANEIQRRVETLDNHE